MIVFTHFVWDYMGLGLYGIFSDYGGISQNGENMLRNLWIILDFKGVKPSMGKPPL